MKLANDFNKIFNIKLNQLTQANYVKQFETGTKIPKIVHQTYYSKELPLDITNNINQLKLTNPDWTFKLYDDDDITTFIETEFPELLKYYLLINPNYGSARADFFRYLLLYKVGGVYLDIKSSLAKNLDEIIVENTRYILAHWYSNDWRDSSISNPNGEFQQWHIITVSGHPFLHAVINNVCRNIVIYNPIVHDTGFYGVLRTTGPIAYTIPIQSILEEHVHKLGLDKDLGLNYSIYGDGALNNYEHHRFFKKHYSQLKEPVIKQPWYINMLFPQFSSLRDYLKYWIFVRLLK